MNDAETQMDLERIVQARHPDPFAVLGRHVRDGRLVVRAHLPSAGKVTLAENNEALVRPAASGPATTP